MDFIGPRAGGKGGCRGANGAGGVPARSVALFEQAAKEAAMVATRRSAGGGAGGCWAS